jgi:hypothetical protein
MVLDNGMEVDIQRKTEADRDGVDVFSGRKLWPTVVFESAEGIFRKYTDGKWKKEEPDPGIVYHFNEKQIYFRGRSEEFSLWNPVKTSSGKSTK